MQAIEAALAMGAAAAWAAPCASAAAAGASGSATTMHGARPAGSSANERAASDRAVAAIVLVPTAVSSADDYADGCGVRFCDGENFRGREVTLSGPVEVRDADPLQMVWHDWDGAIVGPKATVQIDDNDEFKDRTATRMPGQRLPELESEPLGLFGQVSSLRLSGTS